MRLQIKENHAGVMTLQDGTEVNYGTIRVTQNLSKLIYYTGKGLREIFKPDMTADEQLKSEALKKLDENTLMKSGHIAEILISEIKELT